MDKIREQYGLMRCSAAYIPLQTQTIIDVRGDDRSRFLHNLCSNDVIGLSPGTGCEAFFCSVLGKILGHVRLLAHPDFVRLETVGGQSEPLLQHLDKYIIREDVELIDQTESVCQAILAGSTTDDVVRQIGWKPPPDDYLAHWEVDDGSISLVRVGDKHIVVQMPTTCEVDIRSQILSSGANPCDVELAEVLRIERGIPTFGVDIDNGHLPQEVCRDALAISFTKGCYLGQETVARIDALGHVNWNLVRLKIEGDAVPTPDTAVYAQEKEIGKVTSAVFSPAHSSPVCLARIRREAAESGEGISVEGQASVILG